MSIPDEWKDGLQQAIDEGLTWPPKYPRSDCPHKDKHRGPEGPNEDTGTCKGCGAFSYSVRPEGESFGLHADDCSLPERHESYCVGGGVGHARASKIRGYWKGLTMQSPYKEEL